MAASKKYRAVLFCFALCLLGTRTKAFSLLGPFAPWMTPDVGFSPVIDVGGPRNLGDEFRWNVPVLTYGFDDEFKNFFGDEGVAAVVQVMEYLNTLPPASQINLDAAVQETRRINVYAEQMSLMDLRSAALVYVVEQLGLGNSIRYTWVNVSTNAPLVGEADGSASPYVIQRNFDPYTLEPTAYVAGARYTYRIETYLPQYFGIYPERNRIASIFAVDSTLAGRRIPVSSCTPEYNLVPWLVLQPGICFTFPTNATTSFAPLTRDDLGGLRYLLSSNNVNGEVTIPGLRAAEGLPFVNAAPRPGVERITFQRFDAGSAPITLSFPDLYFYESLRTQIVERVVTQPDILFTAAHHPRDAYGNAQIVLRSAPHYSRQSEVGPGTFFPGVTISFEKLGDIYAEPYWVDPLTGDAFDFAWSLFNSRSIEVTPIFPVGSKYQGGRTLSIKQVEASEARLEWTLRLIQGVQYAIETSSDLKSWTGVTNIVAQPIHSLTNAVDPNAATQFWRARRTSGE